MSTFVGIPPFSISLWVAMETMHFHIAHTMIFLRTPSFRIWGVPMNNLAPMKNCPGVQGNLNWMPGYWPKITFEDRFCMVSLVQYHVYNVNVFTIKGHSCPV